MISPSVKGMWHIFSCEIFSSWRDL